MISEVGEDMSHGSCRVVAPVSGMSWRHDTGTLAVESYVRDARLWGDYRRKETEWRENGESVQCSLISPYFGCDKLYFWRKVPISYSCDD